MIISRGNFEMLLPSTVVVKQLRQLTDYLDLSCADSLADIAGRFAYVRPSVTFLYAFDNNCWPVVFDGDFNVFGRSQQFVIMIPNDHWNKAWSILHKLQIHLCCVDVYWLEWTLILASSLTWLRVASELSVEHHSFLCFDMWVCDLSYETWRNLFRCKQKLNLLKIRALAMVL